MNTMKRRLPLMRDRESQTRRLSTRLTLMVKKH
jgi:hypothetical protein